MIDALPAGIILPYAGPVNNPADPQATTAYPDYRSQAYDLRLERMGWLVCDGRRVAVARYPHLFRAIGYIHGQDGPGWFLLPDYRGRVLRGVNMDALGADALPRDPENGDRHAGGNGGWRGNQVGSVQSDALQAHEHLYQKAEGPGGGSGGAAFSRYAVPQAHTDGIVAPAGHTPPITVRRSPETRVKNAYVNFLIRHGNRPQAPDAASGHDDGGIGGIDF